MTAWFFDTLYKRLTQQFPQANTFTMDAGYKTPWIAKRLFDGGRVPCFPYKRPQTMKDDHEWYETMGQTGSTEPNDDLFDNATHNPNTGDGRDIWAALLLGSLGAAALVKLRPRLVSVIKI